MQHIPFLVGDRPFVCWDWELQKKSNQFLRELDPSYFLYVAETHASDLTGEDAHHAAAAIRLAYSQALETLFALLGAIIQAPQCPLGWVLCYENSELDTVVRKVSNRESLRTRLNQQPSWELLAQHVHSCLGYPADKITWIQSGFARTWRYFASEFLEDQFRAEYNALKHGLRARFGGFSVAIGMEEIPGQSAPGESMVSIGGSEFGSSFFRREALGDRVNFRPRHYACNWDVTNMLPRLALLTMSINNTASYLRILGGDPPEECKFETPTEQMAFEEPWRQTVGVTRSSIDTVLGVKDISPLSKQEVLATYDTMNQTADHPSGNSPPDR